MRWEDRKYLRSNPHMDFEPTRCQKDKKLYRPKVCYWWGGCSCHDPITGIVLSYNKDSSERCIGQWGNTCKHVRDIELSEYESENISWLVPTQCTGPNDKYWSEKQRTECGCKCVNKYTGITTKTGDCQMRCPEFNRHGKLIKDDYSTRKPTCYGKDHCN